MPRDRVKKTVWLSVICVLLLEWPILALSKSCLYGSSDSSQQCGSNATCVLNTSEDPNSCPPGDACFGRCMPNE